MLETAIISNITWEGLGGLVLAVTTLLTIIIGSLIGLITKMIFNKLDAMGADIKKTNDLCVTNNTEIKHLTTNHEECKEDREKLHSRVTASQGGV